MGTKNLSTYADIEQLADQYAAMIINELQLERVDVGEYVVTGVPDNYNNLVASYTEIDDNLVISRIAGLVEHNVESYIDIMYRVGDKPLRQGQSVTEVFSKAMSTTANSAEDLMRQISTELSTDIDIYGPMGEVIRAIYEYKISNDLSKLTNKLTSLTATYPELSEVLNTLNVVDVPAMPGQEYEAGSVNVPAMPGVTYEASKAVPIKKIGQDEDEESFVSDDYAVNIPPEKDIDESMEKRLSEPGGEDVDEEDEEEFGVSEKGFQRHLKQIGIDPEGMSEEELKQYYEDYQEQTYREQEEEGELAVSLEDVKEQFAKLTQLEKEEQLEPKQENRAKMTNGWFNSLGWLPLDKQNTLLEIGGYDYADWLQEDLEDAGEQFAKREETLEKKYSGTSSSDKQKRIEFRKLYNDRLDAIAQAYLDYITQNTLTIAGLADVMGTQNAMKTWVEHWAPDLIEPIEQITRQTALNSDQLLPEVARWKARLDSFTDAEGNTKPIPNDVLNKIPPIVEIDTGKGIVNVPNPLYENAPYKQYFEKVPKVPTEEELSELDDNPSTQQYWKKRVNMTPPEEEESTTPKQPYIPHGKVTLKQVEDKLSGPSLSLFTKVLDFAVPETEGASEVGRFNEMKEQMGEDDASIKKWISQVARGTGEEIVDIGAIFFPLFREETTKTLAPEEESAIALDTTRADEILGDMAKERSQKNRAFSNMLLEQGLDTDTMSPEEYEQALMEFKYSQLPEEPVVTLPELSQTVNYISTAIEQELAKEEASGVPQQEYFTKLPEFTAATRAKLTNILDSLLSYQDDPALEPVVNEVMFDLRSLDEMDEDIEVELDKLSKEKEEYPKEQELEHNIGNYRDAFYGKQFAQDQVAKLTSEVEARSEGIENGRKEYEGLGKKLSVYNQPFIDYLRNELKGTNGKPEDIDNKIANLEDGEVLRFRRKFADTLEGKEKDNYNSILTDIISLEHGTLAPVRTLQHYQEQIDNNDDTLVELGQYLKEHNVDADSIIYKETEKAKEKPIEEQFREYQESQGKADVYNYVKKHKINPNNLTESDISNLQDRILFPNYRRQTALNKTISKYRHKYPGHIDNTLLRERLVSLEARTPWNLVWEPYAREAGVDPNLVWEALEPAVKAKRAEINGLQNALKKPEREKMIDVRPKGK